MNSPDPLTPHLPHQSGAGAGGTERRWHGQAASAGIVLGRAHVLAEVVVPTGEGGPTEQARAREALQQVAARLAEASARFHAGGRTGEAEIVDASALMAEDPALLAEIDVLARTRPAAAAILEATERHAALLAAIPDPYLAARAADVRRLGRQAARLASARPAPTGVPAPTPQPGVPAPAPQPGVPAPTPQPPPPHAGEGETGPSPGLLPLSRVRERGLGGGGRPDVLIAQDLGPTDLAEVELAGLVVAGIALAEGSETSHAAIVARALGVPLVIGLGAGVLETPEGTAVVLDGARGLLVADPAPPTLREARAEIERQRERRAALARDRAAGAVTTDGHRVRLLVNASTEREVLAGLEAGAEGVGLLRTELAFLDAPGWPDEAQHEAAVRPVLRHLPGRLATVRTLDFGLDKTPPFLRGRPERGIALHLTEAAALAAQLRALVRAGASTRLRIVLPLVERPEQLQDARRLLATACLVAGWPEQTPLPRLGAMIETRAAVERAEVLATRADFLSIGTNDLAQDVLGLDRLAPEATIRAAADPRVLRAVAAVTAAAGRHGRSVEVCGEAAGDPDLAVLLIGLGVTELSVAPARLDEVRAAVRAVSFAEAEVRARAACRA